MVFPIQQYASRAGQLDASLLKVPPPTALTIGPVVNVAAHATGGDGSSGNPWTGWDTAITWAANTTYDFPAGYYRSGQIKITDLAGVHWRGAGRATVLKYQGTQQPFLWFTANQSTGANGLTIEGMIIDGGGTATTGIFMQSQHTTRLANLDLRNFDPAANAIHTQWCVTGYWPNVRVSHNVDPGYSMPLNGLVFNVDSNNQQSTDITLYDPRIEGVSGIGLYLLNCLYMNVVNGTSEGNGVGVEVSGNDNRVTLTDCEVCTTAFAIAGDRNVIDQGQAFDGIAHITGGHGNVLRGGSYNSVTVDSGAARTILRDACYNYSSTGAFSNASPTTVIDNVVDTTFGVAVATSGIIDLAFSFDYNTGSLDTWQVISGLAVTLTPGIYELTWELELLLVWSGGSPAYCRGAILDGSNAPVSGSVSVIAYAPSSTAVVRSASKSCRVTVSATTTYHVGVRANDLSGVNTISSAKITSINDGTNNAVWGGCSSLKWRRVAA